MAISIHFLLEGRDALQHDYPGKRPQTVCLMVSLRSGGVEAEDLEIWTQWAPERGDGGDDGDSGGDGAGEGGDDGG